MIWIYACNYYFYILLAILYRNTFGLMGWNTDRYEETSPMMRGFVCFRVGDVTRSDRYNWLTELAGGWVGRNWLDRLEYEAESTSEYCVCLCTLTAETQWMIRLCIPPHEAYNVTSYKGITQQTISIFETRKTLSPVPG